jgi:hypothetical protein
LTALAQFSPSDPWIVMCSNWNAHRQQRIRDPHSSGPGGLRVA